MSPAPMLVVGLLASVRGSQQPASGAPVRVEFRVFDGTAEITATTRVRVRHSGTAEAGTLVEGADLTCTLAPGIYDAEASRQQSGKPVEIRVAEHLVVMTYPDEAGRHLEVINFANGYGALQLRWAEAQGADASGTQVAVFKLGDSHAQPARVLHGSGYLLIVVPADTYDLRVARPGHEPVTLADVEVPPGGTRLKLIR